MKAVRRPTTRRPAFTLVELMIAIVIVAVLASLVFIFSKRAMLSARRTAEASNIRQAGISLTALSGDLGYYPMGWDGNRGKSWAGLVVEDMVGSGSGQTQHPILWSPILERDIPLSIDREAITHFGANPAILTDVDGGSQAEPKEPKFQIRPAYLRRPAEQILLAGAVPRSASAEYSSAHAMMWQMRGRIGGNGGNGSPPQLNPRNSQQPINFPDDLADSQQYGSLPDFYRGGDGRAIFLFVDGHVERMAPGDHKQKHWAVSY